MTNVMKRTTGLSMMFAAALAVTGVLWGPGAAYGLTAAEIANLKGPERQNILVAGARKEGKVTWYSAMIINQALRPLAAAFQKKYPFVKLDYWRGSSRKIVQKVLAEIRAKSLVADVLEGSGLAQPMVKAGAVQPFHSPSLAAYPKKYRDPKGLWAASRFSYMGMAYNTKLISPSQAPKSYQDLLDPKWKGKMAWRASSESGALLFITNIRLTMGEAKAESYLQKLKGQKIINFSGSARTLVNRVVEGEYPIALNIFLHHPIISAAKGAPSAARPLEPVPSLNGTIMLPRGVKNPHAAMLLIDFVLSKEGQTVLKKANYLPAHPKVDPKSSLKPIVPRLAGLKENFVTPETLFENRKKSKALFNKYFR